MTWTAYIADTRTGRVLDEFPITAHSWAQQLAYGDDATGSVTIPLEPPTGGIDPKDRLRSWVTGPWRYSIVLARGPLAVWAGPIVDHSYDGSASLSVGCASIRSLLERRIVVKPGYETKLADPASDSKYGPASLRAIAAALLKDGTSGKGSALPITFDTTSETGQAVRHYLSVDLATYDERIKQLTEVIGGPDVVIQPQLSADAHKLTWHVRLGNPELRQKGRPHQLDYQAQIIKISVDYSGTDMINRVWVPGQAPDNSGEDDRNKPVGYATSDKWVSKGFPRLEASLGDHSSTKELATLTAHAQRYIAKHEKPRENWTLTVDTSLPPELGTYLPGDDIMVRVDHDHWIPDGTYQRRITGISGDASDLVQIETLPVEGQL